MTHMNADAAPFCWSCYGMKAIVSYREACDCGLANTVTLLKVNPRPVFELDDTGRQDDFASLIAGEKIFTIVWKGYRFDKSQEAFAALHLALERFKQQERQQ